MAVLLVFLAACLLVDAAPPSPGFYNRPQLQQNPLGYYLDNQEQAGYYQQQQKIVSQQNGAPSRLEDLDPDTEVELVPGVQQPAQPPQQNPVAPNIPGLIPGMRVFYVPIRGYGPGGVAYQPVYVMGAAPGNGPLGNAFQNGVLLDPSQGLYPGLGNLGYPGQVNLLYPGQGDLQYRTPVLSRPYNVLFPQDPNAAYQPGQVVGVPVAQPLVDVKQVQQLNPNAKNAPIRVEDKDDQEERQRARPASPHNRNKA